MNTLVGITFVGMNGSPGISVLEVHVVWYAAEEIDPSRTCLECIFAELQRGYVGCHGGTGFVADSCRWRCCASASGFIIVPDFGAL